MRAAALHILDEAERDADPDKVNALEAPDGFGPEIIPASWTPEHVTKRILEAFETLTKLPPDRGPRVPGNSWPQHVYDWADRLAQEELSEQEKIHRRRARNVVRVRPGAEDLRRMDIVLGWLSELAKADQGLCRVVQRWARLRSTGRSVKGWCAKTGLSFQVFYRQRDKGVLAIVERIGGNAVW